MNIKEAKELAYGDKKAGLIELSKAESYVEGYDAGKAELIEQVRPLVEALQKIVDKEGERAAPR